MTTPTLKSSHTFTTTSKTSKACRYSFCYSLKFISALSALTPSFFPFHSTFPPPTITNTCMGSPTMFGPPHRKGQPLPTTRVTWNMAQMSLDSFQRHTPKNKLDGATASSKGQGSPSLTRTQGDVTKPKRPPPQPRRRDTTMRQ